MIDKRSVNDYNYLINVQLEDSDCCALLYKTKMKYIVNQEQTLKERKILAIRGSSIAKMPYLTKPQEGTNYAIKRIF